MHWNQTMRSLTRSSAEEREEKWELGRTSPWFGTERGASPVKNDDGYDDDDAEEDFEDEDDDDFEDDEEFEDEEEEEEEEDFDLDDDDR